MALDNKIIKQVDRPDWEWLRFLPATAGATSCLCFGDNLEEKQMYYISGTGFYKYDTISDGFQQLASPPTAIVTMCETKYSSYSGYRGNCLGATSNTIDLPGLNGNLLVGHTIRLTDGTGQGQERTITSITHKTLEFGVATAAGANSIGDSLKRWKINEFIGCQVRLVYNTGLSQVRKVLYNDTNTLYFYDINYQQLDPWNNVPFSATAPYALPVTTAGLQTNFIIEKSTATVNTSWDIIPDYSTSFCILSGGVWLFSSQAAAPWSSFQYYDKLSDTWVPKTSLCGLVVAAVGTDITIERTGEYSGAFLTGTATSGTVRTLVDTSKTLVINQYSNYQIRITSGTGLGQRRRITQNLANTFFVERPWDITPDATTQYTIYGNTERIYLFGNNSGSIYKYNTEKDIWFNGNAIDYGQTCQVVAKYNGQEPYTISTGVRGTNGVTAINPVPVAGGTGYVVGEIITSTMGTSVQVRVTEILAGGIVSKLEIYRCGTGGSVATAVQSSTSGVGTGCTFAVTSIGTIGRMTTITNHNLYQGDSITIAGASEGAWNTTYTILAVDSLTTFDILITATATIAAAQSLSTSLIVDASKNWTVNEHIGKIIMINNAGNAGTSQFRRITANTATTLTLQSAITAATNGTSRYVITQPQSFGSYLQYRPTELSREGIATSGTTTTLTDNTKSWIPNQWLGYKFRICHGTGFGSEITISSNTKDTLTYTTQTFTPDTTTDYIIMDSFGLATAATNTTNATITDTTKNWKVNQLSGRRLRITSGTGQSQEITITSNTATIITCSGVFTTAPSTDSTYTILESPIRGAGILANWIYNCATTINKGKYIIVPRGGNSNVFDRYNITNETLEITQFMTAQTELLTTGSHYTYDGSNFVYFEASNTGRIFRLNVDTFNVELAGIIPFGMGTAVIGNRMEIIKTVDGLKFLYICRNSGTEFWRTMLFW